MDRTLSAMMKVMREIEHGSLASKRMRCRKLWQAGVSIAELAQRFHASERSIYNWVMPARWRARRERDARIRELRAQGVPVAAIACEMGLTKRRIYQILKAPPKPPKRFRYFW